MLKIRNFDLLPLNRPMFGGGIEQADDDDRRVADLFLDDEFYSMMIGIAKIFTFK